MSTVFLIRFLIIVLAMLTAGVFGYMLARFRLQQDNTLLASSMSSEVVKMRRRASAAEASASAAHARLARSRRRERRRQF